ncbi:MAG: hypothetical protein PHW13_09285 [Methylococcales bacterium]|nr:hypothetical protein [Methylococcales bacterium]
MKSRLARAAYRRLGGHSAAKLTRLNGYDHQPKYPRLLIKLLFAITAGVLPAWQTQADTTAQAIAFNCRNCHTTDGAATAPPTLDNLSAPRIRESLLAFKYDQKPATIMPRIAKGYSDTELAAVADLLGRH